MGRMIQSGTDVVAFLRGQHREIQALLRTVVIASGTQRVTAFAELTRMLAIHEAAEEEIVHPAAGRWLLRGELVVDARLQEEYEAKLALAELERLDFDSEDFEVRFQHFKSALVAHAEAEEREELVALAEKLDSWRLTRMRRAAELADSWTSGRPDAPAPPARFVARSFSALLDRSRNALSSAR